MKNQIYPTLLAVLVTFTLGSVLAAPKDELSIALNAEFETLNPLLNTMMTGVMVQDAVLRPLVMLDPAGKPLPVLIKKIPELQGKNTTLEFLPEAQWGDGQPLTCKDLEASWKIGNDPLVAVPNKEDFKNIQNIEIDSANPKKCTVTFTDPAYNFYLNFPRPLPAHLEIPVFKAQQGKAHGYERNSLYALQPSNPGLYNGPFRVSEIKFGSHVVVVANEKFFGQKPYFKKLIFRFILNSPAMETNLISGNVQMTSSAGMNFDQALAFQKKIQTQNLPYDIQFVPGTMYAHIEVNLDDPALKDVSVRKALALSFNRQEMSQSFFEGKQPPALHFSTPFDDWYTDSPKDIVLYPYSKRKANELLDKAGWKMGADSYRSKNGKRLSFVISTVVDNKLNETLAVYLQNQWKQVGVEVQIKTFPTRVFFAEILRRRNFQLALLTWVNPPNMVDLNSLTSTMIPNESNGWAGHNRAGWRNKQVDEWLRLAYKEFDKEKRVALMRKVLHAYTEELPALPAYYRSNNSITPKGLKGYEMSGHNYTEYLRVENWHY